MARISDDRIREIFSQNLEAILDARDINPAELARKIGMEKQTVYAWIKRKSFPSTTNLQQVINVLDVTQDDLLSPEYGFAFAPRNGNEVYLPHITYAVAPIVGCCAAGEAREAIENPLGFLSVPEGVFEQHPNGRYFRFSGESMVNFFKDGEYGFYDPDMEVQNDDIAVVYVNGDEATCKRVWFDGDFIILHPENDDPAYEDVTIDTSDPSSPSVTFGGPVIYKTTGDKASRIWR